MKVSELIEQLKQMPQDAEIVITGVYGSETTDFDVEIIKEEDIKHYWSLNSKTKHAVRFSSDLSSG